MLAGTYLSARNSPVVLTSFGWRLSSQTGGHEGNAAPDRCSDVSVNPADCELRLLAARLNCRYA